VTQQFLSVSSVLSRDDIDATQYCNGSLSHVEQIANRGRHHVKGARTDLTA